MMQSTIFDNRTPDTAESVSLYLSVDWGTESDYPVETWDKIIAGTTRVITAYDENRLIGILRILSDGHHDSYICDCVVHPDYQKQGVGTAMIKRAVELYGHTSIYLMPLIQNDGFFERFDFKNRSQHVMPYSRKTR